MLGFFPTSAPITVRTAIVGLTQALSMFVGNFTQASAIAWASAVVSMSDQRGVSLANVYLCSRSTSTVTGPACIDLSCHKHAQP